VGLAKKEHTDLAQMHEIVDPFDNLLRQFRKARLPAHHLVQEL